MTMRADILAVLPEALLLVGALGCLVLGSWTPRLRQGRVRAAGALAVVASLVATVGRIAGRARHRLRRHRGPRRRHQRGAARGRVSLLLLLVLAGAELSGHPRESELCVLMLLGGTGVLLLASVTDLALLVVAFLLSSLPLYGLVGLVRRPGSAEAT